MRLPHFELYRPRSLPEALQWLHDNRHRRVKPLAGGTDLLVDMRSPVIPFGHKPPVDRQFGGIWEARAKPKPAPEALCALWTLPELRGIREESGQIVIGAMTTLNELERSPLVKAKLPALWDGAYQLGSTLVRNRGTYGGNLCNARPAADTAVPTLALNGRLKLVSVRGERWVDHKDFTTGPGNTVREPDELLIEIAQPIAADSSAYIKLANRKSLEISVVGAAAAVEFVEGDVVKRASIALGAVAPTVILAAKAAESLVGRPLTNSAMLHAANVAASEASPISDHRGGAGYRGRMVEILVRRVLNKCLERAGLTVEANL